MKITSSVPQSKQPVLAFRSRPPGRLKTTTTGHRINSEAGTSAEGMSASSTPIIVKWSNETVEKVRESIKSNALVLFTPVVATSTSISSLCHEDPENVDPFELLGRSLAIHHARVRHVPFVPAVGLTVLHEDFLIQAGAVIIVLCEPESEICESVSNQLEFAKSVRTSLKRSVATGIRSPISMIVIRCGSTQAEWWSGSDSFDMILDGDVCNAAVAQQLSDLTLETTSALGHTMRQITASPIPIKRSEEIKVSSKVPTTSLVSSTRSQEFKLGNRQHHDTTQSKPPSRHSLNHTSGFVDTQPGGQTPDQS